VDIITAVNKEQTKQINRIVRPIITLIIVIVLMIMIPIISGFAYLGLVVFGQHIAYIACQIILNLYGPLIIIVIIMILPTVFHVIAVVSSVDKKIHKPYFKNMMITVFVLIIGVYITFHSFHNLYNLILDIGSVATSNYAKTEGVLELYEIPNGEDTATRMKINEIKFEGGNVQADELIVGDYYKVEYLPHSRFVVKYIHE